MRGTCYLSGNAFKSKVRDMTKVPVYFAPVKDKPSPEEVSETARKLFEALLEREHVTLGKKLALKVHFGEMGNRTFLPAADYNGIVDLLEEQGSSCCYIETCVLYGGKRFRAEEHRKLAQSHGFTRLPVIIADGESGEEQTLHPISGKHFRTCSLGRAFDDFPQVIVCSHFKGHALAGFGGALKQLSMGFASKGGKLAMHMGIKPKIRNWLCKRCGVCQKRCQAGAITLGRAKGEVSRIDHEKCLGCGACFSACPHHAVSILSLRGLSGVFFQKRRFREKLAEYAAASHSGHRNIYLNFALSITRGCDCEPRPMFPLIPDIGIFASLDPVAVDQACWDACAERGRKFKGTEMLEHAEKAGAGSRSYELIRI